jgi:capsular exopolysaccharide synthesis family protein
MSDGFLPGPSNAARHQAGTPRPGSNRAFAPEAAFEPEDQGTEGKHLRDYLRVLYKRRWIAAATVIVVAGLGILQSFLAIPVYEAKAQLLIELDNPSIVNFKEVVQSGSDYNMDYYPTQHRILQSRSLAKRTIETHNLWKLFEAPPKPAWTLRGTLASAKAQAIAVIKKPFQGERPAAEPRAPDETEKQSGVIDAFLSGLAIVPIRNSRLVEVKYTSTDPVQAMTLVNALSQAYIEQNAEFRSGTTREASNWLQERLDEQRKKVEASELSLQKYREGNGAVPVEGRENIIVQRLGDMNQAVTTARTERIQKEALYRQLLEIQQNNSALDTFPAILSNTFIQQQKVMIADLQRQHAQLAERLGDKHPEMVKVTSAIKTAEQKLQLEITKVTESVHNEYLAAEAQEKSLAQALEAQKREALDMNRAGIEFSVLTREAESNRQIYQTLLQRANEMGITGELKTNNVRLIDAAELPRAAVAGKSTSMMMSLLLGLLAACGLVFFLEYLDNRIKTPDEIHNDLGLAFMGMVPVTAGNGHESLLINNGAAAPFLEAFRTVRTNVLFSSIAPERRSIVVSSTAPGEGKTVVSTNLAIALAQAGQRVLAIDGDMRRPQVHERFGMSAEPGLSNLLVGDAKRHQVVHASNIPNLWVLPSGKIPPNPAELLSSKGFRELVALAESEFDWVIVDSPPLMAVTDGAVIAHSVTNVLFVVAADKTPKEAAKMALHSLNGANAHVLGAVLNRVNLNGHRYYYSKYYRREYGNYYSKQPT